MQERLLRLAGCQRRANQGVTIPGSNAMTTRYMVGTNIDGKSTSVTVMAEDALIAALKVKQKNPAAAITYVRKHNVRGDRRHPHRDVAKDLE
jgi:cytidine deaminase